MILGRQPSSHRPSTLHLYLLQALARLLLVVRPGAPSSVRTLLVAMPLVPSSFLLV